MERGRGKNEERKGEIERCGKNATESKTKNEPP